MAIAALTAVVLPSFAQELLVLPKVSVYSEQVANQVPVSTFAMPVSGLAFEPQVDVQSRNFAEAQADISIRGGIFENTGFKVGAVSLFDPQTGHYFAELPIAPAMLGSPRVLTGTDNAAAGFNAEVGTVAYSWSPISTRGELGVAAGEYATNRQSFYQGYAGPSRGGWTWGADVDAAHSESDGSVPFGDHQFKRVAGRVQLRGPASQTDVFLGWQSKFFGWPNLYTPFGFNETERLRTELYAINHRAWSGPDSYWQLGAYYRRNFDDYEFNRAVPGASNPFEHTTHVRAVALEGRAGAGEWAVAYGAQYLRDNLQSTSLTFGRFRSRDYVKLSVVPEYTSATAAGALTWRGGATYDDTNRDSAALSPLIEVALKASTALRLHVQYAQSTQVPTYTALNSSATSGLFRGNPNLGREKSRNLEAGAEWAAGAWQARAAVFHRWDDQLVDWTYRRGVTARTASAVDIETAGFECIARHHSAHLDLILGYTYLAKDANYGAATIDASFYALNFARHRVTAAVVARVAPRLEIRVDNEYRVQAGNFLRTAGGDDALLSGAGIYYFPAAWRGLELSFRVDNVWGSKFQEVPSVPAAGRLWVFGAGYHW